MAPQSRILAMSIRLPRWGSNLSDGAGNAAAQWTLLVSDDGFFSLMLKHVPTFQMGRQAIKPKALRLAVTSGGQEAYPLRRGSSRDQR